MPTENQQPLIDYVPDPSDLIGVIDHELHNDSLEVPESPVMSKQEALREYGINADIRAIVTLPSDGSDEPAKQVGIIDFGQFDIDKPPFVITIDGKPEYSQLFGRAKGRYGVYGLNYSPKDHLSSYEVLEDGVTDFGSRAPEYVSGHSLTLGLTEVAAGNDMVAPNHFSIEVSGQKIRISDHSELGTRVTVKTNELFEVSENTQSDGPQPIGVNSIVNVLRSNGEIDPGWIITGITQDELTGKKWATVVKSYPTDDKDNVMSKKVEVDALRKLND